MSKGAAAFFGLFAITVASGAAFLASRREPPIHCVTHVETMQLHCAITCVELGTCGRRSIEVRLYEAIVQPQPPVEQLEPRAKERV